MKYLVFVLYLVPTRFQTLFRIEVVGDISSNTLSLSQSVPSSFRVNGPLEKSCIHIRAGPVFYCSEKRQQSNMRNN